MKRFLAFAKDFKIKIAKFSLFLLYFYTYQKAYNFNLFLTSSILDLNTIRIPILSTMLPKTQRDLGEKIKEELLPRPDKYQDLINSKAIPTTNQSVVVIPCLTKTYGFKTNQFKYQEKYLKGVVSEHYFNSFIKKANQIIENQLIKKSESENAPFFKLISSLLKISIALSVLALLLMVLITYFNINDRMSDKILYASVALLCSSSLVAALCPIYLYNSKYSSLNYEQIIGEKLKTLEGEENKANEAKGRKHIVWRIQNKFYWIQLHIIRYLIKNKGKMSQEDEEKQYQ